MSDNALMRRQQNDLMIANAEPGYGNQSGPVYPPTLSPYTAPWYQRLPNAIGDGVDAVRGAFGADPMGPGGREYTRSLFGTQNPLNFPGQVHEGIDTALGGYAGGDVGRMAGGTVMAAMPFVPMPGKLPKARPQGIRAYHGSPHDFEKFDLGKIGSGEGAQAYGRGLYFAENEGVARSYRDALTPKGKVANPGHMYEVNINANPEHFLDWDKPLSQQSDYVRKALGIPGNEARGESRTAISPFSSLPPDTTGPDIYRVAQGYKPYGFTDATQASTVALLDGLLAAQPGAKSGAKAGSRALKDLGIPGISYDDAGSRGIAGAAKTRNHVVFDDKLIEILKKYGLAGMMAGGAASQQGDGQQ